MTKAKTGHPIPFEIQAHQETRQCQCQLQPNPRLGWVGKTQSSQNRCAVRMISHSCMMWLHLAGVHSLVATKPHYVVKLASDQHHWPRKHTLAWENGIFEKHKGISRISHFDILKMVWHQPHTRLVTTLNPLLYVVLCMKKMRNVGN